MKDKLAPQTTKPAIKNSPSNFVFGIVELDHQKNQLQKSQNIIEPMIGLSQKALSLIEEQQ